MENIRIEALYDNIKNYSVEDINKIKRAYEIANYYHDGQFRKSGEPYITHPINVAYKVSQMKLDADAICAALLHDTVEDTKCSLEELKEVFNDDVAILVDGVTKINNNNENDSSATLRKIITSCQKDIRIILIKLCDRLHNMQTLEFKSQEKQKKIALETVEIYTPLAYYLGAYRIKHELEDLSLKYLEPSLYNKYKYMRDNIIRDSSSTLIEMSYNMNKILDNKKMNHSTKMRIKNIYGIYRKMELKHQKLEEIHDLLNLKIMLNNDDDCYLVLKDVHKTYHPFNSKFKDYICNPKTNMYQSLHTTVFAPDDRLVQVQIKTFDMDKIATFGLAAYWDQKQGAREKMQEEFNSKFQFINSLKEIDKSFSNNEEFVSQVKEELFSKKIYVFTTSGEVCELPEGSNAIDFAYALNYKIGNQIERALVNGQDYPIDKPLEDGSIVQILTNYKSFPQEDWLNKVHTTKARRKNKEYNEIKNLIRNIN